MYKIVALLLIVLFTGLLYADAVFTTSSATPEENRVTIVWITKSETNIKHFKVMRSNDGETYIELTKMAPKGPGTRYEYVDEKVMFRGTSVLFYKVQAIDKNGNVISESIMPPVHPNISSIFRTWGAIKAMFAE